MSSIAQRTSAVDLPTPVLPITQLCENRWSLKTGTCWSCLVAASTWLMYPSCMAQKATLHDLAHALMRGGSVRHVAPPFMKNCSTLIVPHEALGTSCTVTLTEREHVNGER